MKDCLSFCCVVLVTSIASAACSGDSGAEGAGGTPRESSIDVAMNGQELPLGEVQYDGGAVTGKFASASFNVDLTDGGEVTVDITTKTLDPGTFELKPECAGTPFGDYEACIEVELNGTAYLPVSGTVTLTAIGDDGEDPPTVEWFEGGFDGSFEDPADELYEFSGTFTWTFGATSVEVE